MDASLLAGTVVIAVGLLSTAAGLALRGEELSLSSLAWLTTSVRARPDDSAEARLVGVLLAGAGLCVQFFGAIVITRPQYDVVSMTLVALAWLIVTATTAAIRSTA